MGEATKKSRKKLFDAGVNVKPERCPFCGGNEFRRDGKVRLITRWRCKACGHGWVEPANRIEANLWAKATDLRKKQAKRLKEYRLEQVEEARAEGDESLTVDEEAKQETPTAGRKEGYFVRCPSCRGIFHETTDKYDPSKPVNGAMLRLIEPYRTELNWYSFPGNDSISYACCECPDCGSQYCSADGRLIDVIPKSEVDGDGRQDQ